MISFSVIIATKGRPTLTRTLESLTPQLQSGDEVMVERLDCHWGHEARDQAIPRAAGSHLLFIDDDDIYTEDALATIRSAVEPEPERVHVFQMQYPDGRILWKTQDVRPGNIGTPMVAIPNQPPFGTWGTKYEGDFHFLASTMKARGDSPVFHDDVVALIRP